MNITSDTQTEYNEWVAYSQPNIDAGIPFIDFESWSDIRRHFLKKMNEKNNEHAALGSESTSSTPRPNSIPSQFISPSQDATTSSSSNSRIIASTSTPAHTTSTSQQRTSNTAHSTPPATTTSSTSSSHMSHMHNYQNTPPQLAPIVITTPSTASTPSSSARLLQSSVDNDTEKLFFVKNIDYFRENYVQSKEKLFSIDHPSFVSGKQGQLVQLFLSALDTICSTSSPTTDVFNGKQLSVSIGFSDYQLWCGYGTCKCFEKFNVPHFCFCSFGVSAALSPELFFDPSPSQETTTKKHLDWQKMKQANAQDHNVWNNAHNKVVYGL
jgi:hypothetical protein